MASSDRAGKSSLPPQSSHEGGIQRYLYTLDRKRADKNDILVERET
jgi:hypothetical protein